MTNKEKKRRQELVDKIDDGVQNICDAVLELIGSGVRLKEIEFYIKEQMGTIFNKGFKAECDRIRKERESHES